MVDDPPLEIFNNINNSCKYILIDRFEVKFVYISVLLNNWLPLGMEGSERFKSLSHKQVPDLVQETATHISSLGFS